MRLFKKLLGHLDYLDQQQVEKIYQAYEIAASAHEGQKRHSGETYITHPVAVATILAEMHMGPETLMAALMHDVIEDTDVTKAAIVAQFGESIADLVDGVSKLTQIEFQSRAEKQAENFRKMVMAMAHDIRVIIVKLADRLHNMRTLGPLPSDKRRRIAKETLEIFAPIAKRLGMHNISTELQDLGFTARYPDRARVLKRAVRKVRGEQKKIINLIEKGLNGALAHSDLPSPEVIGREKHLYSIYKKMRDKKYSFSEIMDVYGFRIVTDSVDTCYRVLGIVHNLYKPLPERFKDYIAIPKANGYQSLHTTIFGPHGVPTEVQIRTKEMEARASSGVAAHWLYKADNKVSDRSQVQAQKWVSNLLEMQKSTGSSLEFIENVKIDLFPDEVYVFTPRGRIMELPDGATPIDFAYSVHTDVGNMCVAAKVDRQLVPLSYALSSGQTVEIITTQKARPNPAWLNFVITAKARSNIRHFIKHQQRNESIVLGKQLLTKSLESLSLSFKKIPKENIQNFLSETHLQTLDDLFEEIGLGDRVPMLVAHQLVEKSAAVPEKEKVSQTKPLMIKGTEGFLISFGTCCYPIPGDPIIGLMSAGNGIIIHHDNCSHITKLRKHPEYFLPVNWSEDIAKNFNVAMRIEGLNRRGVLAKITTAIADVNANIDDIHIHHRDERSYSVTMILQVRNINHLEEIIRSVWSLKSVTSIERKI